MQRHRPQIFDRQGAGDRWGAGDPQREAQDVITCGGHCPAVSQARGPDMPLVEPHIGVHRVAAAMHH